MNIYFFGGSFDPTHIAHKLIYKHCITLCDKFIFLPAACSPGKNKPLISSYHRIQMLKLLIDKDDITKVSINDFETKNNDAQSYTVDTIDYLKSTLNKNDSLYMILGFDQYNNLNNWKDYKSILNKINGIICFNRSGESISSNSFLKVINFNHDISSSFVRNEITNKNIKNIKNILDSKIYNYIINNNLYKN